MNACGGGDAAELAGQHQPGVGADRLLDVRGRDVRNLCELVLADAGAGEAPQWSAQKVGRGAAQGQRARGAEQIPVAPAEVALEAGAGRECAAELQPLHAPGRDADGGHDDAVRSGRGERIDEHPPDHRKAVKALGGVLQRRGAEALAGPVGEAALHVRTADRGTGKHGRRAEHRDRTGGDADHHVNLAVRGGPLHLRIRPRKGVPRLGEPCGERAPRGLHAQGRERLTRPQRESRGEQYHLRERVEPLHPHRPHQHRLAFRNAEDDGNASTPPRHHLRGRPRAGIAPGRIGGADPRGVAPDLQGVEHHGLLRPARVCERAQRREEKGAAAALAGHDGVPQHRVVQCTDALEPDRLHARRGSRLWLRNAHRDRDQEGRRRDRTPPAGHRSFSGGMWSMATRDGYRGNAARRRLSSAASHANSSGTAGAKR
jgi:hypothetical protein